MEELTTTLNTDQLTGMMAGGLIGAMLGSLVAASLIIQFIYWILKIIGCWKIFGKFGEPGWKCIIPIYSTWVEYKYTWKPSMAIWLIACSFISSLLADYAPDNVPLSLIASILAIAAIVLSTIGYYKLSKSFGHGIGFTIGLFLIPGIFQIILGFGRSQYIGNTTQDQL